MFESVLLSVRRPESCGNSHASEEVIAESLQPRYHIIPMCWNGEASAVLAATGLGGTAFVAYRGEDKSLWMALGYFSLMEALQAYTYTVIDKCGAPNNQIATLLGYLHIAFQPFFINMVSLYFVPKNVREKIAPVVYTICFISLILFLVRMYPFDWMEKCDMSLSGFCGPQICSASGQWHIAWEMPVNGFSFFGFVGLGVIGYGLPAFILPMLYGSWRFTAYHFIMGPLFSRLTTNNLNEWAAVWCLYSIGFLLLVLKTGLRKSMFVNKWYFWKYPWVSSTKEHLALPNSFGASASCEE